MEDIWSALTRYHREVVQPDNEATADRIVSTLRSEMDNKFDAFWQELDDLKNEYGALKGGIRRLERLMNESKFDPAAMTSQIDELKVGISELKRRVAELEARL